jgi:hypothetical protein
MLRGALQCKNCPDSSENDRPGQWRSKQVLIEKKTEIQ